jgi:hypothetical protein
MRTIMAVLGIVLLAALAFGQAPEDELLGPHEFGEGCFGCHAPHNGATANGLAAANGKLYLWARSLNIGTYSTYNDQFTLTTNTQYSDPVVHSQLCFSCHDGSVSKPMGDVYVRAKMRVAYGGNLTNDHPVHVQYIPGGTYWKVTITGENANFDDTSYTMTTGATGHPAKLFVSGTDLYVECTTCHNPHRYTKYAYPTKNGSGNQVYVLGGSGSTEAFIRGPYSRTNGALSAAFCRSCHYGLAMEYVNNSGAEK